MRNVFLIIGSAFPFAILRNIFLGRELNETDMGLMSLLITIISFVYPITLLGQHNALIRFLSKDDNIRQYDWKQYNRNIVYLSGIIAGLCSIIFVIVYNLASEIIVFLTIAIIASVIGDLYKEVVRAQ